MALARNPKADLARNLMTPQHTMADSMDVEADAPSGPDSMSGLLQAGAPDMGGEPDGDEGQVSPEVAGYEEPATGSDKCQDCEHFMPDSESCQVVTGLISPDGWCKLFSQGGGASAPGGGMLKGKGPAGESTGATPLATETRSDHEQIG